MLPLSNLSPDRTEDHLLLNGVFLYLGLDMGLGKLPVGTLRKENEHDVIFQLVRATAF
jgi:hypothetical protein